MGNVGQGQGRMFTSASLLKQGSIEHVTQDCVQAAFYYLQRRRLHKISRQPVSVLSYPHCYLPRAQMEHPVFQFVYSIMKIWWTEMLPSQGVK